MKHFEKKAKEKWYFFEVRARHFACPNPMHIRNGCFLAKHRGSFGKDVTSPDADHILVLLGRESHEVHPVRRPPQSRLRFLTANTSNHWQFSMPSFTRPSCYYIFTEKSILMCFFFSFTAVFGFRPFSG